MPRKCPECGADMVLYKCGECGGYRYVADRDCRRAPGFETCWKCCGSGSEWVCEEGHDGGGQATC